jgi:hypothetical protein
LVAIPTERHRAMSGLLIAILDKLVDAYGVDRFRANRKLMLALGASLIVVAIGYLFVSQLFPRAVDVINTIAVAGIGLTLIAIILRAGDVPAGRPEGVLVMALVSMRPVTPESSEGAAQVTHGLFKDLEAITRAGAPILVRLRPEPLPLSHTEEERVADARRVGTLPRLDAHLCVFGDVIRHPSGELVLDLRVVPCAESPGIAVAEVRWSEIRPGESRDARSLAELFLGELAAYAGMADPTSAWAVTVLAHVPGPMARFNRALILVRIAGTAARAEQYAMLREALSECDRATGSQVVGLIRYQDSPGQESDSLAEDVAHLRAEILIRLADHERPADALAHFAEAAGILRSLLSHSLQKIPGRRALLVNALAESAALQPGEIALARDAYDLAREVLQGHRELTEDQLAMIVGDFANAATALVQADAGAPGTHTAAFFGIIDSLKAAYAEPFLRYRLCLVEAIFLQQLANLAGPDRASWVSRGLRAIQVAMDIAHAHEMSDARRGALYEIRGHLKFHQASTTIGTVDAVALFEESIADLQVGMSLLQHPGDTEGWWASSIGTLGARVRVAMLTAPSEASRALLETSVAGLRALRSHPHAIPGLPNHGFLMALTCEALLELARYREGEDRKRVAAEALMAANEALKVIWSDPITSQLTGVRNEAAQLVAGATTYSIQQPISG